MVLKELLEILRETHPQLSDNMLIKLLNRASDDFCTRTNIIESSFKLTDGLVVDQRYYDLTDDILGVTSITIEDETAPQLIGTPKIRDVDL